MVVFAVWLVVETGTPLSSVSRPSAVELEPAYVKGSATMPLVRSMTIASFQVEPSALTLKWKSSSPASPSSARPEKPVW